MPKHFVIITNSHVWHMISYQKLTSIWWFQQISIVWYCHRTLQINVHMSQLSNKKSVRNKMFHQNASKFAIFHVKLKPIYFFVFHLVQLYFFIVVIKCCSKLKTKNDARFLMHKIWQISKHFAKTFHRAQNSYFWWVYNVTRLAIKTL